MLLLIGPLVRRLAAEAPGVTIRIRPRSPDPVRMLRDGDADLVIEPTEIVQELAPLASRRLFTDRWLCCVWEGNRQVGDELSLQTYLQLGHIVYSTAAHQPGATVDTYLARVALPRRVEFIVQSFLLAPTLLQGPI